ncbi:perlucin-like protein isoform X2 [Panulirus ornatus]
MVACHLEAWATASTPTTLEACPIPYVRVSGRCLFFDPLATGTWHQTQALCESLHGNLAKIDTGIFMADIVDHIREHQMATKGYWMGASDEGHEGDWRWRDGTSVRMGTPFWGYLPERPIVQEPRRGTVENCGCLIDQYLYFFHDCPCSNDYYSPLCEYRSKDYQTTTAL